VVPFAGATAFAVAVPALGLATSRALSVALSVDFSAVRVTLAVAFSGFAAFATVAFSAGFGVFATGLAACFVFAAVVATPAFTGLAAAFTTLLAVSFAGAFVTFAFSPALGFNFCDTFELAARPALAAPRAGIAGVLRSAVFVAVAREAFAAGGRAPADFCGPLDPCDLAAAALVTVLAAVPTPLPPCLGVAGRTTAEAPGRAAVGPALRLGVAGACLLGDVARFIGLLTLSGRRTDPA